MTKEKNYKRIAKKAAEDKVNNLIFIMKFLNNKGGLSFIEEYFAEAIPNYVIEFEGVGGAKKWVMRQWIKRSPHDFMQKMSQTLVEDGEIINPAENYELLEDNEENIVSKLKCNLRKNLIKTAKKYQCDFDVQDYYCNHACIPILIKVCSDIYLKITVELTKDGCIQTLQIDKSSLSKDDTVDPNQQHD